MKLSDAIALLEGQMESLLQELQRLKQGASALEEQNRHLRTLLYQQGEMGAGFENLLKLYGEGFHICPAHFAGARAEGEDCIFCLSFLEGKKVGGQ